MPSPVRHFPLRIAPAQYSITLMSILNQGGGLTRKPKEEQRMEERWKGGREKGRKERK